MDDRGGAGSLGFKGWSNWRARGGYAFERWFEKSQVAAVPTRGVLHKRSIQASFSSVLFQRQGREPRGKAIWHGAIGHRHRFL